MDSDTFLGEIRAIPTLGTWGLLLLLVLAMAAPAAAQVDLRFAPDDTTISVGDTLRMSIMLDQVIDVRTIDVHVGRLREKLGDDAEQPLYVMTVRGVGYRAAPQQEA